MKYACFNINFDSLGQMYGFPDNFDDPTFTVIADRFFKISDRFGFKYSIYVIGRDLENPKNRDCVKRWADQGHEIGNHSWSHPLNLGAMPPEAVRLEVGRAHDLIAKTVGKPPSGFIAPGWSGSDQLLRTLVDYGYEYDTSVFPSWLIYPSLFKMLLNHVGSDQFTKILHRKDLLSAGFSSRKPFVFDGKLLELPLPTNPLRIALWHTLYFVLGRRIHEQLLSQCLKELEAFYYLVHPGDLLDRRDLDPRWKIRMERLRPDLEEKSAHFNRAVELILKSGRKIVTMREMAEKIRHA